MANPTHQPAPFTRLLTTHSLASPSAACASAPPACSASPSHSPGPPARLHPLSGPGPFQAVGPGMFFSLVYTSASRPEVDGQNDADIDAHERRHDAGNIGLTYSGGTVCRVVEWAPNSSAQKAAEDQPGTNEKGEFMHLTESLDYGIVISGEVELILPSQPPRRLKAGDICVQRGTMHAWRNASAAEPARMVFVLIAADKVIGPRGEEVKSHLPPLDKEIADMVGLPEGKEGTEQILCAKRV